MESKTAVAGPQRPKIENPKFFELLQANNIIDGDFIRDLLDEFEGNALDVLATLIQSGVGTKRRLCQLWCDSIGIAHVDLEKTLFQPHIVRKLPERVARLYYAIPVYQMGDTVTVATATPDNKVIEKTIEQVIGEPVSLVFALPQDVETAIENEYQTHGAIHDFFNKIAAGKLFKAGGPITAKQLSATAGSEAINQLHVAMVLYGALEQASEIHLAGGPDKAIVEYRGNLRPPRRIELDMPLYDQLLARLKALAGLSPDGAHQERHGRIVLPVPGKKLDVSLECRPAEAGETALLRLTARKPFARLGSVRSLHAANRLQEGLETRLSSPTGLFLLAGPARSGKTTFAYALLRDLRHRVKKIVTVEKQIKFLLPAVDQLQVNDPAGFSAAHQFASAMKLRPNAIYLQELSDPETAAAAADAGREGSFVIAGIRATDSSSALNTAAQLGCAETVCGVLLQHLAARLCDHCKQSYALSAEQVQMLFFADPETRVTAWQAKGCPYCNHTGFSGRIGIHELLLIDHAAAEKLGAGAPIEDVRTAAGSENYYNLRYDGIKKVLRGLTTLDEIDRLTSG